MADIFISYARDDRDRVEPLVRLLEAQGWSVWWDREILPGRRFERIIDRAITEARCVIVVWTSRSAQSDWVNAEAGDGLERGILIPILLENVRLPLAFRSWQAARLEGWPEEHKQSEVEMLLRAVKGVLDDEVLPGIAPGQRRRLPQRVYWRWAGVALSVLMLVAGTALLPRWNVGVGPTTTARQVVIAEPIGRDPSFLARSLVHEIATRLKGYSEIQATTYAGAPDTAGGYMLLPSIQGGDLTLDLEGPDGEPVLSATYQLEASELQNVADEATQRLVAALELRYFEPPNKTLGADDFRIYLEASNALRSPETTSGLLDQATEGLEGVLGRNTHHARTMVALCRLNLRLFIDRGTPAFFEAAERHCHRARTLDGEDIEAQQALGRLYAQSGMYDEAVTSLLQVLDRTPYNVDAMRSLGETYQAAGAWDLAEAQFRRATQLEPGYWRNHKSLGDVMLVQARYEEAVQHYWRAADGARDKSQPLGDLAAALYLSGEFEDAVDVWKQTLDIDPLATTYSNLGSAYYFLERFREAAEMYEHAIQLAPDDHLWWGHAGEAYLQFDLDNAPRYFRQAITLAERARSINPADPLIISRLATYHAAMGEQQPARELIARARGLQPADIDVLYDEAVVWARLGAFDEARRTIAHLIQKGYSPELIERDADLSF